jgi:hypothetical protein
MIVWYIKGNWYLKTGSTVDEIGTGIVWSIHAVKCINFS